MCLYGLVEIHTCPRAGEAGYNIFANFQKVWIENLFNKLYD